MSFPVSKMWRCDYDCILAYVFRAGLVWNVRGLVQIGMKKLFLYDLVACSCRYEIMYAEVRRTLCNLHKYKMDYRWKMGYVSRSRSEDDNEWLGSLWCSICWLKHEAWKWIKMGVKWELWIKMADFLLEWQFGSPIFFVRLVMIHMHNESRSCICM